MTDPTSSRATVVTDHVRPGHDRYVIKGVVGPDEFHTAYPGADRPGLDNNANTNVMPVWVLLHLAAMAGSIDLLQRCVAGIELRSDTLWINPYWPPGAGVAEVRHRLPRTTGDDMDRRRAGSNRRSRRSRRGHPLRLPWRDGPGGTWRDDRVHPSVLRSIRATGGPKRWRCAATT
jgi:hypothetical protein